MIFESIQAVADKVAAEMVSEAPGVPVRLYVKKAQLAIQKDALAHVAIIPAPQSTITLPTRQDPGTYGEKAKIVITNKQVLEIHCWAKAPTNVGDLERQDGDDLTQAERLRTKVAKVLLKYCEGVGVGGTGPITQAGENTFGVELVLLMTVEVQGRDLPLTLAPSDTVFGCDCGGDESNVPAKFPPP